MNEEQESKEQQSSLVSDVQIEEEANLYIKSLDFTNDNQLNEKGENLVAEWCKADFIAGANFVRSLMESKL